MTSRACFAIARTSGAVDEETLERLTDTTCRVLIKRELAIHQSACNNCACVAEEYAVVLNGMSSNTLQLMDSGRNDLALFQQQLKTCVEKNQHVTIVVSGVDGFSTHAPSFAKFFAQFSSRHWHFTVIERQAHSLHIMDDLVRTIDAIEAGHSTAGQNQAAVKLIKDWSEVAKGKRKQAAGSFGLRAMKLLDRNVPKQATSAHAQTAVATIPVNSRGKSGTAILKLNPSLTSLGFQCAAHCEEYFEDLDSVKAHITNLNQNGRLYGPLGTKCVIEKCDWTVTGTTKTKVAEHSSRHIPTLSCPEVDCPVQWKGATKHDLARHNETYHSTTKRQQFKCDICGKDNFLRKENVTRHKRYNCPKRKLTIIWICPVQSCSRHEADNGYDKIPALQKHLLSHLQDREVKEFARKLDVAIGTHNEDEAYELLTADSGLESSDLDRITAEVPTRKQVSKTIASINLSATKFPHEVAPATTSMLSSANVEAAPRTPTSDPQHPNPDSLETNPTLVPAEAHKKHDFHARDQNSTSPHPAKRSVSMSEWLGPDVANLSAKKSKKQTKKKIEDGSKTACITSFFSAGR